MSKLSRVFWAATAAFLLTSWPGSADTPPPVYHFIPPITKTGTDITCRTASSSASGCLLAADFAKFDANVIPTFIAPLVSMGGNATCNVASSGEPGCLSSADWTTFNSKQSALSLGNLSTSTTGVSVTGGTGAVVGSGATVNVQTSSSSQPGLLSAADWTTFNSKQGALSLGNLTSGTTGVAVSGGTGAVVGAGAAITVQSSTGSQPGLLSAADWTTFNGKQSSLSFSTPLVNTAGTISCNASSSSQAGCLSSADWSSFNSKQAALTLGNLTSPTSGVTVGAGTGAVVGSGTTVSIQTATGSLPGLLSAADWTTFNGKQSALTFTAPLVNTTGTVTCNASSSSQPGCLSSTDWSTFNGKQAALSLGNLTEATSSVLTISGGTGAVVGAGSSIQVKQSSSSQSGYLSSADWSTFNGKQASGSYITALVDDVTGSGPGSTSTTVAKIQGKTVSGTTGTGNVMFSASPTTTGTMTAGIVSATNLTVDGLRVPTTGSLYVNTPVGSVSGQYNTVINSPSIALTSGQFNVASGYGACSAVTSQSSNVCIGVNAGNQANVQSTLQAGAGANTIGDFVNVLGAMAQNGSGIASDIIGASAGSLSITGSSIECMGTSSCQNITSGSAITCLGRQCGDSMPGTTSNYFMSGSSSYPRNDVYFGKGFVDAAPTAWTLHGSGGSGSNVAGGGVTVAGGAGTGTGVGGSVLVSVAPAGTTGSSANALVTALTIDSTKLATFAGDIVDSGLTASRALVTDGSKKLISSATTATELGYVSGVTSPIQTQINACVQTVGAIDSQSTSANGIVISGSSIYMQSASATVPGTLSIVAQSIAGAKTLSADTVVASNTASKFTFGNANSTAIHALNGGINWHGRTVAASFSLDNGSTDHVVQMNTSGGAYTVTLPTPSSGREFIIGDATGNAATNNITIARHASEKINGASASYVINVAYGRVRIDSDGTDWYIESTSQPINLAGTGAFGVTGSLPFASLSGTATSSQVTTATFVAPTVQAFTTGSGTYTLPTSPRAPLYIHVEMVGGGGGGAGSGSAPGAAGTGGNTTFGTTLLVANGGGGGGAAGSAGGTGGTASLGSGPVGTAIQGASGTGGSSVILVDGNSGASSPFGGAGAAGLASGGAGVSGGAAIANTGSGGGGGGSGNVTGAGGGGGAAGGYDNAFISSPASTYSYAVGSAGAAGTAGTAGSAGGAGGSGYIRVTEYYQ